MLGGLPACTTGRGCRCAALGHGLADLGLPGKPKTRYVAQQADGRWVVHAQAQRSASMYRRTLRIEPEQLGSVRLLVEGACADAEADVRHSDTEDAVVRVLLAFDGDHDRLSPRTRMMFDLCKA